MMADTKRINELVNEALLLYAELALKPESDYFDQRLIEELNVSRDLDPTGLTTFMMLRGQTDRFLDTTTFSARRVLLEYDAFRAEVGRIYDLFKLVEDPEVVALIEQFQTELRAMAGRYKLTDRKAFESLLADKGLLAVVRRNALRSMQTLEAHQFLQGAGSPEPLKVHGSVYEFWNINSVLAAMRGQEYAGVSLCLIRDPAQVMASYFCFAVRNGDNITILTDREEGPHPLYYQMSRRPGRTLAERAERHHFPYELLDLEAEIGSAGTVKDLHARQREQLVPINTEAVPLKALGALEADQFVWAGLVLNLLAEKYGGAEPERTKEVSYTGEMVAQPTALVSGESSLVRAGHYKLLNLRTLTGADVTAEKTRRQWRQKPTGVHEWMIERYGAQVPDEVLNPVGDAQAKQLTGEHAKGLTMRHDHGLSGRHTHKVEFEALSPTTFGSRKKLQRDRVWAARVNQCRYVQALADKEYKREAGKVQAWMRQRVQAQREYILNAAAAGEIDLPDVPFNGLSSSMSGEPVTHRQMWQQVNDYFDGNLVQLTEDCVLGTWSGRQRPEWRCADTGQGASVMTVIEPTCPEAYARLFGVSVDELHFGLRHRYRHEPYEGNSILQRLDPSDWQLDNPWNELKVKVFVALSKTAANARRRAQGLAPRTTAEWEEMRPAKRRRY
jgi:hypothetical protein